MKIAETAPAIGPKQIMGQALIGDVGWEVQTAEITKCHEEA